MSDNPFAIGPFFLTRQAGNLMEDFARETSHSSSLFLLYGDGQVKEASSQDIIILHHFEAASNTARHQVFQSWDTGSPSLIAAKC